VQNTQQEEVKDSEEASSIDQEEEQKIDSQDTTPAQDTIQATPPKKDDKKKLIDINISSLEDIILYLEDKKYDFATLEPEDMQVKVTFRQDNIEREVKYVKFPVYTNILFKTKQVTKLIIEDTGSSQE